MPLRATSTELRACYRRLKHYKYQLMQDFLIGVPIRPTEEFESPYMRLTVSGGLIIKKGYAWDGPSGPTIDTRTFMRASLVHDALYQLMRLGVLNELSDRKMADDQLRSMCIDDGMYPLRAWYVYYAVRLFGGRSARPVTKSQAVVVCAP